MIPFNRAPFTGAELPYIEQAVQSRNLAGDGPFTKKCHTWFEEHLPASKALLTTSCTHALELAAFLLDVQPGDEIIMPSYTFVSTANAFAVRGAKIVFVDIEPDTMNIDPEAIQRAVSDRTRAIVVVHYAGVGCDMDRIMEIAREADLPVVEDAAQGFMARYHGRMLGTIANLGCYSFHETKNVSCGEGGLLIVNDKRLRDRAEIIREKGTNRARFLRGMVDKYTWIDIGSSYLPSELNAAYLYGQLQRVAEIQTDRMGTWDLYAQGFAGLASTGRIELARIPDGREHNAHMFYVKTSSMEERQDLMSHLTQRGIGSAFHYVPLHSSPYGYKCGRFSGVDKWTTVESERLLRLPLWFGMGTDAVQQVIESVLKFYS